MKRLILYIGFFFLLLIVACKPPHYISSNFEAITVNHKIIAVLPFEMIYLGKQPENMTEEDWRELERIESEAFQISFLNEILRSTKSGKKPIRVDVQDHRITLDLLQENGIDIKESWYERPERLAELLGVDAVVCGKIEKYRFMSDLASFGIDVANEVINTIAYLNSWNVVPQGNTTAKQVQASYSLIDKDTGQVLWSIAFTAYADWSREANAIIDDISRQGAKTFPYRIK